MSNVPRVRRVYDREQGKMVDATELEERRQTQIRVSPLHFKSEQLQPGLEGVKYDSEGRACFDSVREAREVAARHGLSLTVDRDQPTASEIRDMYAERNAERAALRRARKGGSPTPRL